MPRACSHFVRRLPCRSRARSVGCAASYDGPAREPSNAPAQPDGLPPAPLSLSSKSRSKVVPYNPANPYAPDTSDLPSDGETRVKFWLKYRAEYGQRIRVVGSCAALSSWESARAPELQWSEGHMWNVTVHLQKNTVHEYKFVLFHSDGVTACAWQQGNNAVLAILDEESMEVFDEWYDAPGLSVVANGQRSTRSERLITWAETMAMTVSIQRAELRRTRMDLFQAEEEARTVKDEHLITVNSLLGLEQQNRILLDRIKLLEEDSRSLRVQLVESQVMFQEAMTQARELLLSTLDVELDAECDDEDDVITDVDAVTVDDDSAAESASSDEDDGDAYAEAVVASDGASTSAAEDEEEEEVEEEVEEYQEEQRPLPSPPPPAAEVAVASTSRSGGASEPQPARPGALDDLLRVLQQVERDASEGQEGIARATATEREPAHASDARAERAREREARPGPLRVAEALSARKASPQAGPFVQARSERLPSPPSARPPPPPPKVANGARPAAVYSHPVPFAHNDDEEYDDLSGGQAGSANGVASTSHTVDLSSQPDNGWRSEPFHRNGAGNHQGRDQGPERGHDWAGSPRSVGRGDDRSHDWGAHRPDGPHAPGEADSSHQRRHQGDWDRPPSPAKPRLGRPEWRGHDRAHEHQEHRSAAPVQAAFGRPSYSRNGSIDTQLGAAHAASSGGRESPGLPASGQQEDESWRWPTLRPGKAFWDVQSTVDLKDGNSSSSQGGSQEESRWGRPIRPFY